MLFRLSFGALAALAGSSSAAGCWFFAPTSLDGMAEATIRAQCHFAFACCTAPERSTYSGLPFRDEATCVAESLEEGSQTNTLTARAKAVVAAGNADFDGQRADQCVRPMLDALNSCDAEAVVGGGLSTGSVCGADWGRVFVVGKIADGEDCTDDLECADYGTCVREDPPENTVTIAGRCRASRAEGEVCFDPAASVPESFNCVPGTSCVAGDPGEASTCRAPVTAENGEPCSSELDCDSGYCDPNLAAGVCDVSGDRCIDSGDCGGGYCIMFPACAEPPSVTVEVCDGA